MFCAEIIIHPLSRLDMLLFMILSVKSYSEFGVESTSQFVTGVPLRIPIPPPGPRLANSPLRVLT